MAILEDEDAAESVDEEQDGMTSFSGSSTQAASLMEASPTGNASTSTSSGTSTSSTTGAFLAEIFAQEYKARNRVREIKKMRQYFQKRW